MSILPNDAARLLTGVLGPGDHCDDWQAVSEADRDEAITIVLDNIFAHPDQAAGLGLDVGLLEELWR